MSDGHALISEHRWGEPAHDEPTSRPFEHELDESSETTRDQVSGEVRPLLDGDRAAADGRRGEEPPHYSARDEGDTVDQSRDLSSKRDLTK
jgi:hypothetical protein